MLQVLKSKQQPLELVFPWEGPLHPVAQVMDGLVEQPLATALGTLAVAWVLFDVGNQTGVEDCFAIGHRVKPAVEVEIRPLETQPRLLANPLQGLQPVR